VATREANCLYAEL